MTVPKKQSTAAKKARAVQQAGGGKYTAVLAEQAVCGKLMDPYLEFPETCARPPHPQDEPCSLERDFDAAAWKERVTAECQRDEEDWVAREREYEWDRAAADDGFDPYAKYYGDED
ncbi:hypothetical protein [Streptomyces scabiei]|uniref:hypothetical protein n=1 Tax=Streptomyces scabiei TaxID=1930 RepID=UPI0038F5FF3B